MPGHSLLSQLVTMALNYNKHINPVLTETTVSLDAREPDIPKSFNSDIS